MLAVYAPAEAFAKLWPTRGSQDSLLGNAFKHVNILASTLFSDAVVRSDLHWGVNGEAGQSLVIRGKLTIEPGAFIRGYVPIIVSGTLATSPSTTEHPSYITAPLLHITADRADTIRDAAGANGPQSDGVRGLVDTSLHRNTSVRVR